MAFGNLKKGDRAIVVYCVGENGERRDTGTVISVGPMWITVQVGAQRPEKFQVGNGCGEYGYSVHTKATLADHAERQAAMRVIARANLASWVNVPTATLSDIATAIEDAS